MVAWALAAFQTRRIFLGFFLLGLAAIIEDNSAFTIVAGAFFLWENLQAKKN